MKEKLFNKGLSMFKVILTLTLVLFSLLSMIYVALTSKELFDYFYCLSAAAFVCFPLIFTLLFKWKMNVLFYVFYSFYTAGPILGAVYGLYYILPWWDDLLHFMAGTIFAVMGAQLFIILNKKNKTSFILPVMFGVFLSMGIAVFWEIYEFTSDVFLNTDMQADTIIDAIFTKINRIDGNTDAFENITETIVNGQSLGINGYLDIGLYDTMTDLIVETLGALVYLVFAIIGNTIANKKAQAI